VAVAIFLRAVNVGGHSVFSVKALAEKLDLVNIGAAGTFVARRNLSAARIAREMPFETHVIVRPAAEVIALVRAGPPKGPRGTQLFVSVLARAPTKRPTIPLERPIGRPWALRVVARRGAYLVCVRRIAVQRGLDLSAILQREFGAAVTTRSWGTMVRVAEAASRLK
jgi:uncharacterized protein (DUF1697 family)